MMGPVGVDEEDVDGVVMVLFDNNDEFTPKKNSFYRTNALNFCWNFTKIQWLTLTLTNEAQVKRVIV